MALGPQKTILVMVLAGPNTVVVVVVAVAVVVVVHVDNAGKLSWAIPSPQGFQRQGAPEIIPPTNPRTHKPQTLEVLPCCRKPMGVSEN